MNQYPQALLLSVALTLCGEIGASLAQDAENGRRLSERWCSECHAIGPASGKTRGLPTFASISAKKNVSSEMIASFLRLPHATMPNLPLSRKDTEDIAAYIMGMKK